jgi:hypothetical protein
MRRTAAVFLVVTLLPLAGCASSAPPPPSPLPTARPNDQVRRLAVVSTGDSKFAMSEDRSSQAAAVPVDGIVSEVAKWIPGWYGAVLVPLAKLVASALTTRGDSKLTSETASRIGEVSPRAIVADAFARRLAESGQFHEVRMMDREMSGDERRRVDAVVRLTVPTWGLLRVREGKPDLVSGFADVRAQMVVGTTGTVVWEHEEDVTHAGRMPLTAFTGDSQFARNELTDMLERAGQRLAAELLYARGPAR